MGEVTLFSGGHMPAAFAGLNPQDDNLSEGIGSTYGVIGYRGKVWSLRYKGETHTFTRPDDGSPINYIDVIILRQARHKSKSYYPSFDMDGGGERPTCASLDGVKPDDDVLERQAATCALCPRNAWYMTPEGRKKRDCADYKRLAVLLVPSQTRALLGQPLVEPVFLRVPGASLTSLAAMGELLAGQGWHYSAIVTRISFDPSKPHPQMVFKPLQSLTDAEAATVISLREDATTKRITGEDKTSQIAPTVQPLAQAVVPQQPKPAPAPSVAPPPKEPEHIDTGFLELTANPQPQAAAPAPSIPVDTGPLKESDANLDARIAALLKKPV